MNIKSFFCLVLLISGFGFKVKGQNYNASFLPARVIYNSDKEFLSNKSYGIEFYFLFKYAEIERKINKRISMNLGVYYSRDKESQSLGSYRYLYYNIDPSIRYYLNNKNNISGFYFGSGVSYSRTSSLNSGRFASLDGSLKENNFYYDALNYNLSVGYKLSVIKNRFSIDFKLNEVLNLFTMQKSESLNSENKLNSVVTHNFQNKIYKPYLDLKLGYRFGFKK